MGAGLLPSSPLPTEVSLPSRMREGRGHLSRPVTAHGLAAAAVLLAGCTREEIPDPSPPASASAKGVWFTDVAAPAGLTARNISGSPSKRYLIEAKGGGAAFLDADGDSDLDIYLLSGSTWGQPDPQAHNRLYRNDGPLTFVEVTASSGLGDTSWSMGVAVADFDNDGDADVYVTNYGANHLFENDGAGRFSDVTAVAGVGDTLWGTGAAWGDYDRDGDLDLYAANFVRFQRDLRPRAMEYCQWKGVEVFYGPEAYSGAPDVLYRNDGGGTFRDVSQAAGVRVPTPYKGFQPVFADLDDDGWPDIYVADDTTPNLFFRNLGDGTFRDLSIPSGTSHSVNGDVQAGMGVDLGDYDGDGDLDIFVTHFSDDYNTLYRNEGGGYFADVTFRVGLGAPSMPWVGWGTAFADLDNDADLDLFVANGHVYPVVDDYDLGTSYAQPNLVFANQGHGVFEDASPQAGPGLRVRKVSRGTAFGDYDDDGDVDILVLNADDTPTLLRNDGAGGHWLGVRLRGRRSNRDGIGARIQVTAGGRTQIREVRAGSSFLSSNDLRAHFGLGAATSVDRLVVNWPSGLEQVLEGLPVDRYLLIDEELELVR